MVVLHLLTDAISFIIPYIFIFRDTLYFTQLGAGHDALIPLFLGQIRNLPFLEQFSLFFVHLLKCLHTSPRTLTRKLQLEDQSFSKIVDTIIKESAEHFLLNTDLSVQEVANKLGFTSQKVFSRTFKRLGGLSPVDFRKSRLKDQE